MWIFDSDIEFLSTSTNSWFHILSRRFLFFIWIERGSCLNFLVLGRVYAAWQLLRHFLTQNFGNFGRFLFVVKKNVCQSHWWCFHKIHIWKLRCDIISILIQFFREFWTFLWLLRLLVQDPSLVLVTIRVFAVWIFDSNIKFPTTSTNSRFHILSRRFLFFIWIERGLCLNFLVLGRICAAWHLLKQFLVQHFGNFFGFPFLIKSKIYQSHGWCFHEKVFWQLRCNCLFCLFHYFFEFWTFLWLLRLLVWDPSFVLVTIRVFAVWIFDSNIEFLSTSTNSRFHILSRRFLFFIWIQRIVDNLWLLIRQTVLFFCRAREVIYKFGLRHVIRHG